MNIILKIDSARKLKKYISTHPRIASNTGCEAILDLAEKLLGYRPGKPDFLGKASVGARLEWQERKWFQYDA